MADRRQTRVVLYTVLFAALALVMMFFRLLPTADYSSGTTGDVEGPLLGLYLSQFPQPDLMVCIALAWVVRRPDLLPAPVIAIYFLLEDLMFLRPPGLWALIMLLGTEYLRGRAGTLRGFTFWLEYLVIAGLVLTMFVAERLILAIVIVDQVPLGLSFVQIIGTIAAYPVVVLVSHFVFKLRKPAHGEVDALGQKL